MEFCNDFIELIDGAYFEQKWWQLDHDIGIRL